MGNLITGDLHLTDSPRDAYRFTFLEATLPHLLQQKKTDELIVLGDITTKKDNHSATLVNRIVSGFSTIARNVPVIIDLGNHDYAHPQHPFFRFLQHIPNIRFIHQPTQLKLSIGECLFLPHTYNYEKDWADIDLHAYKLVFAHNTFEDARSEHNQKLSGIPLSVIEGIDVIAGDVHTPQQIGGLVYVGAPYLVNFGDLYVPRVMRIENNLKRQFIPVPGRQKRLIEAVGKQPAKNLQHNPGDLIKIRVQLDESDQPHWAEIRNKWAVWAHEQKLQVDQIIPVVERHHAGTSERPETRRRDDAATLEAYGQSRVIDQATMAIGRDIAKRV